MSGFLHRLAARAMGGNNTLRSVARLLYSVPPSHVNMADQDGEVTKTEVAVHEHHQVVDTGPERDSTLAQQQSGTSRFAEIGPQPSSENEVTPTSSNETPIAKPVSESAIELEHTNVQSTPANAMLGLSNASAERTIEASPSLTAEGIEINIPMNSSVASSIANEDQNPTVLDSNTLPPLMPLKQSVRPSALNPGLAVRQGESRGSAWKAQVEETSEVHVSIGRIEVTAVHEAPAAKRQV